MPPSIQSIGASAQLNTAWNITNSTAASTTRPATGCSSTASMRAIQGLSFGAAVTHGREHSAQIALGLLGIFGAWRSCHAGAATLRLAVPARRLEWLR